MYLHSKLDDIDKDILVKMVKNSIDHTKINIRDNLSD